MSNKPREARTIHNFIVGLQLLGESIVSSSFYNSSGDTAYFDLDRELSPTELAALEALGFRDYSADRTAFRISSIGFSNWSDW